MAYVASYDDVKAGKIEREVKEGKAWRTDFIKHGGVDGAPHAFLAERMPKGVIRPHFHIVDQFQVIVSGGGVLGKHELAIHAVHFSRAHTAYGPIVGGAEGVGFLTLRAHKDPGAQWLPEFKDELAKATERRPWQATELPKFEASGAVGIHQFAEIRDERGLGAWSLKLAPNAKTAAPDPAKTDGQYLVITKGSLMYQGKEHKAITICFVKPDEKAFELAAGPEGLEALVLNFPSLEKEAKKITSKPGARVWQCQLCSFQYDEAKGMPGEGIAPGTKWEDVPDDWICPDCSTSKADFVMEVVA